MDNALPTHSGVPTNAELDAGTLVSFDAAPASSSGMSSAFMNAAPMIAVFAIIYLLILRPQQQEQKKHQELLSSLKKGDDVVTSAGMHGRIHEVRGEQLVVEIADRVRVVFDRSAVQRKGGGDAPTESKE